MLLRIVEFPAFVFTAISFMKHCNEWLMLGCPFSLDSLLNLMCYFVLCMEGTQPKLPPWQASIPYLIGLGVRNHSHSWASELPVMRINIFYQCTTAQCSCFTLFIWNWVTRKTLGRWQCAYILPINMHIGYTRSGLLAEYILHILRGLML